MRRGRRLKRRRPTDDGDPEPKKQSETTVATIAQLTRRLTAEIRTGAELRLRKRGPRRVRPLWRRMQTNKGRASDAWDDKCRRDAYLFVEGRWTNGVLGRRRLGIDNDPRWEVRFRECGGYAPEGYQRTGWWSCWDSDAAGQSSPPDEAFVTVSAGGVHTCGVRTEWWPAGAG